MDENNVVNPATPNDDTPVTPPADPTSAAEKTFTQTELNDIIKDRLTKAERKYVEKQVEILKRLGIDDESHLDDIVKTLEEHKTLKDEYQTLKQRDAQRENEGVLRGLNVDDDFIDYVLTKVPMGEDFETRAAEFIKANPKILKDTFRNVNSALNLNGAANKKPEEMTDLEYIEYRRNFGLDGKPIKK